MINHARTLLMNIPPQKANYADIGFSGYEYVPKDFVPIPLPPSVASVRKIIFGADPDGLFCGLRARELLGYIHDTEFAHYIYQLDPRVTYWPETKAPRYSLDKQRITINQTLGAARRVTVIGEFSASLASGRAYRNYTLLLNRQNNNNNYVVQTIAHETPRTEEIIEGSAENTPLVVLPESDITLKIAEKSMGNVPPYLITEADKKIIIENFTGLEDASLTAEDANILLSTDPGGMTVLARWDISTRATVPSAVTNLIPALEMLGEPVFLSLFGVKTEEPYATFKNLWLDHPLAVYRLIGLTLALIYRTEEARNG